MSTLCLGLKFKVPTVLRVQNVYIIIYSIYIHIILNLYCTTHQLGCIHLNSHGTKASTTVCCSHLNAQYTHVEA